jgi:antitoxin YefM
MKEHLEEVLKDQDILILSGPKKKDFVVITLEQYNSMEETAYLQSTPANTARLMESIEQHKAGIIAHSINVKPTTSAKSIRMKTDTDEYSRKRSSKVDDSHRKGRTRVSKHSKVERRGATKKR